jgi:MurNAc alpha-1-phosphate uridylyltransferase
MPADAQVGLAISGSGPEARMRAMILAAGRGERMRPLTDARPKPMLEVGGKPLIQWHLESLSRAGIRQVVINHAWLGAMIEAALGDGRRFGVHIRYSPERVALEAAGGIAQALPLLGPAPFLVVNGDIFVRFDFSALVERAGAVLAGGADAHLVLVDNPPQHPSGDFVLTQGRVIEDGASRLTYSGIGIYRPELFRAIDPGSRAPLAPLLRAAMREGRVTGEHFTGCWVDVGTPQRLADLDAKLRADAVHP